MLNNNFQSYGNANHFRNSQQIFNSGNIAGVKAAPDTVAGVRQDPNRIAGMNQNPRRTEIAGMKTMESIVNTNTGPAKQVMNSDGSNMIRNDMNAGNNPYGGTY